jgi:hypothetical protein
MHRRPALLVALAVTAAAAGALAVPSSARLVRAETLGAVTTITATSSGTAELALYDDATLSPKTTGNPDVSISGAGRIVGIDLVEENAGSRVPDELSAMRLPSFTGNRVSVSGSFTPQPTCTAWPNETVDVQDKCGAYNPKAITLHEGYYHLVVITDGAPIRVTLRLHGQHRAHASVHTQRSLRTTESALPERESAGSSTISWGNEIGFADATQVVSVVGLRLHSTSAFKAATECGRSDDGNPPPYAWMPPCPGGTAMSFGYSFTPPSNPAGVDGVEGFGVSAYPPLMGSKTRAGIGGSVVDSDGPTYLGGVGLWIAGDSVTFWG